MKKLIASLLVLTTAAFGAITEIDKAQLGIVNYIKNPAAENGTYGFSNYADSAGTSPVDCTGGSPNSALTASSSSPLAGSKSFLWTKNSGASRQGEGFSYAFSIDAAKQAQPLTVSFDMTLSSGTYSTGDQTIWIYDVTNATLIQPDSYQVQSVTAGTNYKHVATFQSASNSTSYRLCFHNSSSSNTSAYAIKYDNFKISSDKAVQGVPATDWASFTPTITGLTIGNGTITGFHQRIGDNERIRIVMKSGTTTTYSGTYTFSLPTGIVIDTNKVLGAGYGNFGTALAQINASGFKQYNGIVTYNNTTTVNVSPDGGTSSAFWSSTVPATYAAGIANQIIDLDFLIPVVGYSSNVAMSSDSDTRVVSFSASAGATQSVTADTTLITASTVNKDSHGSWNSSSFNSYTVPVAGDYNVTFSGSENSGTAIGIDAYVNNVNKVRVAYSTSTGRTNGSALLVNLKAGDVIDLRSQTTSTLSAGRRIDIFRLSGPAVIAASESVQARYRSTAGQSISSGSGTTIDFGTKVFDSHSAVTTGASWKFTAPVAGVYAVSAFVEFASATWTSGNTQYLVLRKNGSGDSMLFYKKNEATATQEKGLPGSTVVQMLAGDYIDIQVFQNEGSSRSFSTTATEVWVNVNKVGNY